MLTTDKQKIITAITNLGYDVDVSTNPMNSGKKMSNQNGETITVTDTVIFTARKIEEFSIADA